LYGCWKRGPPIGCQEGRAQRRCWDEEHADGYGVEVEVKQREGGSCRDVWNEALVLGIVHSAEDVGRRVVAVNSHVPRWK
jgi:hypothetical protein